MDLKKFISIVLVILSLSGCVTRITDPPDPNNENGSGDEPALVQTVGTASTFELATWNIEWFPKDGQATVNYVKTLIRNLDVDLIGVAEISSIQSFNTLLDSLEGWNGVLSNDTYSDGSYQKTGILYKSSFISVSNPRNIFTDNRYAFPRPPLTAYVQVHDQTGKIVFDFNLITVHLKAMGGTENEARRRAAVESLKVYIDQEIAAGADPDFIVTGDWNDRLIDADSVNVFKSVLDDTSDYTFLTAGLNGQYSYISNSYKSLIDHILITADARSEYGAGNTNVLYLDQEFSKYQTEVSDHRPVVSIFKGITL